MLVLVDHSQLKMVSESRNFENKKENGAFQESFEYQQKKQQEINFEIEWNGNEIVIVTTPNFN